LSGYEFTKDYRWSFLLLGLGVIQTTMHTAYPVILLILSVHI
jgi:hypothetical protein